MSVKQRLIEFLKYKKIGQKKFAQIVGVSDGYVNAIKKSIQPITLHKIAMQFPELNTGWLMTGEGEMLKNSQSNAKIAEDIDIIDVPLIQYRARAGYLSGYADSEYMETLPVKKIRVDREYKGKYLLFEVEGDSMDDDSRRAICDRDIILCREIGRHLWENCKLHYRDYYFLFVTNNGIVIKQVIDHDVDNGVITCHSINPDPQYEDFKLHIDEIKELFSVVRIEERSMKL
jgi:transcriptional regulator with XRE-family HTH domain